MQVNITKRFTKIRLRNTLQTTPQTTLLIFIFLAITPVVMGQTSTDLLKTVTQQVVPTSPQAASIMLYQTYPIDYVSGAPQINIPLFTAKAGAWDLPFSLQYQVGKVKPSVLSEPAGRLVPI